MSNSNPLRSLLMLAALSSSFRAAGGPTLDEMLDGGRQKGIPIPPNPLADLINSLTVKPWSEAPEHVKDAARAAIKAGELEPNCDDPSCEFCRWVELQPEWKGVAKATHNATQNFGGAPDPGERFKQEYGEQVAVQQDTVPGILREAAGTYEQRNPLYGDAYKHYGSAMMAFFPQGLYINEPEDWNRFGLFSMMVSKMTRIANNLTVGGHRDSSLDLAVYAAMMTELTEVK